MPSRKFSERSRRRTMDREIRTVLAVDNSASMIFYLGTLLTRLGYKVSAAPSAGSAAYVGKPIEPDVLYRARQAATESAPRQNTRLATSLKVIVAGTMLGGAARTEYATALSEGGLYI